MNWRQILLAANLPEPPGRDDALKRVYERQRVSRALVDSGHRTQKRGSQRRSNSSRRSISQD